MNNSDSNTILVVEDNADAREMLRVFLELRGYRVVEAANGKEALAVAQVENPDLILMDLNMPVLDGIAAAEQIRQHEQLREVPILANSSNGKHGMELFLNIGKLGDGYIEYLVKPFDLHVLAERIEAVLLSIPSVA